MPPGPPGSARKRYQFDRADSERRRASNYMVFTLRKNKDAIMLFLTFWRCPFNLSQTMRSVPRSGQPN